MQSVELQISKQDWIYIIALGAFFGFFISLFFYYVNEDLHTSSTVWFGTASSISISVFASVFITLSNNAILPKVQKKFWYLISFAFSFLSGALGFLFCYGVFFSSQIPIISLLEPFWVHITFIIGFLTFLIGLILHQFISMKYKNELTQKYMLETKIKALENELNPHFLFNTLNSISELLHVNPQRAEKAVIDLAKFLRNAIKQSSLIELSKEIEMVQTYVAIENIRFSDTIHLHVKIQKKYQTILIPKFSLQLLVENAIKHGYDKKALHVKIESTPNCLHVSNDGKEAKEIVFGTGLNNLRDRLELLKVGKLFYDTDGRKFTIEMMGKR
jgi:sensor histidine kinase YesM